MNQSYETCLPVLEYKLNGDGVLKMTNALALAGCWCPNLLPADKLAQALMRELEVSKNKEK